MIAAGSVENNLSLARSKLYGKDEKDSKKKGLNVANSNAINLNSTAKRSKSSSKQHSLCDCEREKCFPPSDDDSPVALLLFEPADFLFDRVAVVSSVVRPYQLPIYQGDDGTTSGLVVPDAGLCRGFGTIF
uniref:Uncharacterized protein n=1 Tax=Mesocestoides corti TaxID=53468 RepID=A0A5K3F849_MESCO